MQHCSASLYVVPVVFTLHYDLACCAQDGHVLSLFKSGQSF